MSVLNGIWILSAHFKQSVMESIMYKMCGRMFSEKYERTQLLAFLSFPLLAVWESVRCLGTRLGMCGESLRMRLVVGGEEPGNEASCGWGKPGNEASCV